MHAKAKRLGQKARRNYSDRGAVQLHAYAVEREVYCAMVKWKSIGMRRSMVNGSS